MQEKHLKDKFYYENQYDKIMIGHQKRINEKVSKTDHLFEKLVFKVYGSVMEVEDYSNRREIIEKWMKEDKEKDEFYEKANPYYDTVRCKLCNSIINLEFKEFRFGLFGKPDRVLFIYKCKKCLKRRAFYDNGEEFERKINKCKNCNEIINNESYFKDDILITNFKCESCGIEYNEEEDFSLPKVEEMKITENDILKYGYSQEKAKKKINEKIALDGTCQLVESWKKEEKEKNYDEELSKIIKFNSFKLEEYINEKLQKFNFSNFKITGNKEVKTYLECEFEVYYKGEFGEKVDKTLYKILEGLLINTNWRIPKDKIYEKLGIIKGVIYGYDRKEDFIELINKKSK